MIIDIQNPVVAHFVGDLLCLFADFMTYAYIILRIYRIMCYTKVTFDQLPFFNPYQWPLSAIRITTTPYFRFWSKILPTLRLGKYSYDISTIVGLEVLTTFIFAITKARIVVLANAQVLLAV
jgi:hypothetical protein